jgi:hypothetical protein
VACGTHALALPPDEELAAAVDDVAEDAAAAADDEEEEEDPHAASATATATNAKQYAKTRGSFPRPSREPRRR